MEKMNCSKCNKEMFEDEQVWCSTCGVSYCKECAVVGLPKNYDLPVYFYEQDCEDWEGDRGFITDECVNCYLDWRDEEEELCDEKYTSEDANNLSKS